MSMPEPYGITLFCDDIRQEVGGKLSYMGIYGPEMLLFGPKPAVLPKLCIAVHLNVPAAVARGQVELVVFQHAGETTTDVVRVVADLEGVETTPSDEDLFVAANFHLNAAPFQILEDCLLQVRAFVAGAEIKLGGLNIRFQHGDWTGNEPAPPQSAS